MELFELHYHCIAKIILKELVKRHILDLFHQFLSFFLSIYLCCNLEQKHLKELPSLIRKISLDECFMESFLKLLLDKFVYLNNL